MSRQYVNEKWCVRCGRENPTPFLRDNCKLLQPDKSVEVPLCVDIGCGNGRNSVWAKNMGYVVEAVDMAKGALVEATILELGHDRIPVAEDTANLILANYVLMFCDSKERKQICKEINRMAAKGCYLVVELYAAKDSFAKTQSEIDAMQLELYGWFVKHEWMTVKFKKDRFIMVKCERLT